LYNFGLLHIKKKIISGLKEMQCKLSNECSIIVEVALPETVEVERTQ
jgi:hypothetical protein